MLGWSQTLWAPLLALMGFLHPALVVYAVMTVVTGSLATVGFFALWLLDRPSRP